MKSVILIVCVMAISLGSAAMAVTIETVPVGDLGNVGEVSGNGINVPYRTCGAVNYRYNIGKYEVTNTEYAEFLNAVADVGDANGLYNTGMGGGWNDIGGISRTGLGTGGAPWVYSPRVNRGNRPVNYVSVYDMFRFANWLTNGQPSGPQGNGTTEMGSYTLTGPTSAASLPDHAALAAGTTTKWLLTSEDEWYKAAYYKGGGTNAGYWDYPTQSDTAPTAESPAGTDSINGSANYYDGGYVDATYYSTEVGAYDDKPSDSPYGTFDQGGNFWESNDTIIILNNVSGNGVRGSSYGEFDLANMRSSNRGWLLPTVDNQHIGFRVAEVPEPATMAILMLGGIGILSRRRKQ